MHRLVPLALLASTAAVAHPLGRDEYSLRTGLEATAQGVRAVVIGEVPLNVVIGELGRRAGGQRPTPEQIATYTAEKQAELAAGLTVTVDGRAAAVTWTPSPSALNGRAVDGFFVYVVETRVPAEALDPDITVVVHNAAWPDVGMVYAAQVRASDGWAVTSSSAPDDWTSDAAQRSLTARFQKG